MAKSVETARPIRTLEDVQKHIRGISERGFATALLKRNPRLTITYEPRMFYHVNQEGRKKGTLPDFFIKNPRNEKIGGIYVELTISDFGRSENEAVNDPKRKQKSVMEESAPGERYVVLYRAHLERIENAHQDITIFHRKTKWDDTE